MTGASISRPQSTSCLCQHVLYLEDDDEEHAATPRCPTCVQNTLKPYQERHQAALEAHARVKQRLQQQLQIIQDPFQTLSSLQAESEHLRNQIARMKQETSAMAVRVASKAVENDQHREPLEQYTLPGSNVTIPRQQQVDLIRLEQTLLETSMGQAITQATSQVQTMRFLWALQVIKMHRLQIDVNDVKQVPNNKRNKQRIPTGIAKIAGLPLPNAGPELYGVLPVGELVSALRLTASLTSTIARTLSILLPHPILLLSTNNANVDITETVSPQQLHEFQLSQDQLMGGGGSGGNTTQQHAHNDLHTNSVMLHHQHHQPRANMQQQRQPAYGIPSTTTMPATTSSSSSSYLSSMMDGGSYFASKAKKALAKATMKATGNYGHRGLVSAGNVQPSSSAYPQTSHGRYGNKDLRSELYGNTVTLSLGLASNTTATFIPPSTDATIVTQRLKHANAAVIADGNGDHASTFVLSPAMPDDFPIALQLLQNNILTLCIRAGVMIQKLWPAQALLLNLYELQRYCQEQTAMTEDTDGDEPKEKNDIQWR